MDNNKGLTCLGLLVFGAVAIVTATVMNGWALSVLWGWFVAPLFGLPEISIPAAIGFALVVSMLTHQEMPSDNERSDFTATFAKVIARAIFAPLFAVFVGWIVLSFI